ncbi:MULTISPECIES: DUF2931 family protein [Citrobacter freundii complex]|uniref:DUF2931 family protein n=1 Tax=Citrobacter freundii complex TaxID=1344959 RepID=UPI00177F2B06|nr:DUF2931 family protein [Citrobacter portucalensis]MBD9987502.1 DUF2931 family protein [Citrobacter portucalensis]MBE0033529.1 DUF2931 family protein [Citrobacter portucalensis]MBE0041196.1 DUF2931 family protein [Citrobacter portucalensis]MBE0044395.1 DUF2931 family protein [Citrobacter portucalensis]MBE0079514.1 DUF2931 family protein [Citrobacter portucalensis]
MKMRKLLILALLLAAAGCSPHQSHPLQSKQAASGDWTLPYGKWNFSFITPYELPAEALHVRVIDTDGYLYTFNTLDPTSRDSESVDKWTDVTFGGSVNFNKVKKPPQYIVFCWDSYIDQQTYETSAVFGPETWQRMTTPADHTRPSGAPVWYNRMVFGLSPGGKVKIWFSDVAGRPSLPVTPLKLTTRSGKDLTLCKDYVVPGGSFTFLRSTQAFINGKTYPYGNWD